MPFVVYENEERIVSVDYDMPAWNALARNRARTAGFRFPCCDTKVVLTSRCGRPYFRHQRDHTCEEARRNPESVAHQVLKLAIADLLNSQPGWTAAIEVRAADGSWKADVLATDRDGHQLAVEVQLSAQSDTDYLYRTQRYLDAGLLPVWITSADRPALFGIYRIAHAAVPAAASMNWMTEDPLAAVAGTRRPDGATIRTSLAEYLVTTAAMVGDWLWTGDSETSQPLAVTHPAIAAFWNHDANRGDIQLVDANQNPISYKYVASPKPQPGKVTITGQQSWAPVSRAEQGSELAWIITKDSEYEADWGCPEGHRWRETIAVQIRHPRCVECDAAVPEPAERNGVKVVRPKPSDLPIPRSDEPMLEELGKLSFLAVRIQTANLAKASVCVVGVARVVAGEIARIGYCWVRPADPYLQVGTIQSQNGLTRSLFVTAAPFEIVGPWLLRTAAGTPMVGSHTDQQMEAFQQAWQSWPGLPDMPTLWHIDVTRPAARCLGVADFELGRLHRAITGTRAPKAHHVGENAARRAEAAANLAIALARQNQVDLAEHVRCHQAPSRSVAPVTAESD